MKPEFDSMNIELDLSQSSEILKIEKIERPKTGRTHFVVSTKSEKYLFHVDSNVELESIFPINKE